jgi:hypothetical protein
VLEHTPHESAMITDFSQTGAVALEFLTLVWAFRHDNGLRYCSLNPRSSIDQGSRMKEAFKKHVTWICAAYFLAYVGTEGRISLPSFKQNLVDSFPVQPLSQAGS